MNILLIDIDSLKGNLALATISGYYKQKGHSVGFGVPNPDEVLISCIFKENADQARGVMKNEQLKHPNAKVYLGGSGVSWDWLPIEMQKAKPDLDLYSWKRSIGRTSVGCNRNCVFCIVREKEGYWKKWQHISEFYDDRYKKVQLLDNNIYVNKDWFFENTDFILEHNLKINVEQGMDIRIIDEEIAQRIKELKFYKTIRFAFDKMEDEKPVIRGIEILKNAGINIRSDVEFYVLVNFDTKPSEDLYRVKLLKKLGTNPFIMLYNKIRTPFTEKLARYCNRKWLLWSCEFEDFFPGYKKYMSEEKDKKLEVK